MPRGPLCRPTGLFVDAARDRQPLDQRRAAAAVGIARAGRRPGFAVNAAHTFGAERARQLGGKLSVGTDDVDRQRQRDDRALGGDARAPASAVSSTSTRAAALARDVEPPARVVERHQLGIGARGRLGSVSSSATCARIVLVAASMTVIVGLMIAPPVCTTPWRGPVCGPMLVTKSASQRIAEDDAARRAAADDERLPAVGAAADDVVGRARRDGRDDLILGRAAGRDVDHRDVGALDVGDVEPRVGGVGRHAARIHADVDRRRSAPARRGWAPAMSSTCTSSRFSLLR